MSFVQPLMLLGLLGAAVPIIIHLIHRRRPRRQPFAAIELVLRSVERIERRLRLRRLLLLASRVALLAAFALAAARPFAGSPLGPPKGESGPERLALVIDTTLSMRARFGGGESAFDRAKAAVRARISAMGPEDQAILVAAGKTHRLFPPRPTASTTELLAALHELSATYEHGELAEAVTAAARALAGNEAATQEAGPPPYRPRVIVFSDLAGHGIRAPADLHTSGEDVASLELVDVMAKVPAEARINRGIIELQVASVAGHAPHSIESRAKIRGFGPEGGVELPTEVSLKTKDTELTAGIADIPASGTVDSVLAYAFPGPGFVPVSLGLPPDALAEDDVRFAFADVRRSVRALVVDGEPSGLPKEDEVFYLEAALAAGARDQPAPRVVSPDDLAREDLEAIYDVVVLAGVASLVPADAARLSAFVESGGGLLVTASRSLDPQGLGASLERILPRRLRGLKLLGEEAGGGRPVAFAEPALDHPVLSVFRGEALAGFLSATTHGYLLLEPAQRRPAMVLLSYEDGQPALVEGQAGRGRVMILTTSIDRDLTDLPIRPAFVPLVRRLLLYLGKGLAEAVEREVLVGTSRSIFLPAGTQDLEIERPDGQVVRLTRGALAEVVFEPTQLPGHYQVRSGISAGEEPRDFVVNVDPRESDLRPLRVEEATAVLTGARTPGEQSEGLAAIASAHLQDPERLVAWLLAMMLLAFLVESALIARRPGS